MVEDFQSRHGFWDAVLHLLRGAARGKFRMAIVTCDVCGKVFSQSYLHAHKRLAHPKMGASTAAPTTAPVSEKEAMQKIASLYESLSVKGRKRIIRLLSVNEHKILNEQ
jgi:hypothetical protein